MVVAVPAKFMVPVPSMMYEPSMEVALIELPVRSPEFVMWTEPPLVVMRSPERVMLLPTAVIPAGALVLRVPVRVDVPVTPV